jgi:dGTP triphosphohydrolase
METGTLVIAIFTLIAVGVGLYLNHKTNMEFREEMESSKQELLAKVAELKEETIKGIDTSKVDVKNFVTDKTQKVHSELKAQIAEANENISSSKKDLANTIETKISKVREEIESNNKQVNKTINDAENEIKSKVDNGLKTQEQRHKELQKEVTEKFDKILEEIKNPLNFDI